jgi:hypothetical protein
VEHVVLNALLNLRGFAAIFFGIGLRKAGSTETTEMNSGMGRPGLEPGTNALKGRCSTD